MKFCIQTGNPRSHKEYNKEDKNLWEAIESIYSLNNEKAFIIWNNLYVPLCYKYDISIMMSDILNMLQSIQEEEKGGLRISWPSDTFDAIWNITWNHSDINISSRWNNITGGIEQILNERNTIVIPKESYISEWKKLLETVRKALLNAGYTGIILPEITKLILVESRINGYGELYS